MWRLLLLIYVNATFACEWPTVDALFVVDSTLDVTVFNFELIKKLLLSVVNDMQVSSSQTRVGFAKFTPKAILEFSLISGINKEELKRRINMASYEPCIESETGCFPIATINSIAKAALHVTSGNRASVPDAMIIISSTAYRIPELGVGETLMKPTSPVFVFYVSVGKLDEISSDSVKYASSATTIKFSAIDYDALQKLTEPLCDDNVTDSASFGGASAIVVIVIIIIIFIIVLLLLCYAVYRYRKENSSLKAHIALLEGRQYVDDTDAHKIKRDKRPEKSEGSDIAIAEPERTQRTDEGILLKHYDRRTGQVVPISWTPTFNGPRLERLSTDVQPKNSFNENVDDHHTTMSSIFTGTTTGSKHTAMTLNTELTKATDSKKNASVENVDEERKGRVHDGHASIDGDSNKSEDPNALHTDEEMEAMGEVNEDGEMSETDSANDFLPINHPAKTLPPIDLLLLIDSSGSIGLTNFEQMKKYINAVLNNVDISPGRSRVATVIFATEPKVSFGFDKYYTQRSVQASVTKLPYLGGPTFLSKALVFAAGILYQEQNMKDGKHRKHKLMPTPKHDRLQVMIVVSDGYSEDNFDNAATILHEKLHVKIAALVGRSYNKERLMPITRFEGAIFVKEHTEALSIWLWRQQRLWNENFGSYVEKEKSLPLDRTTTNSSPRKKK